MPDTVNHQLWPIEAPHFYTPNEPVEASCEVPFDSRLIDHKHRPQCSTSNATHWNLQEGLYIVRTLDAMLRCDYNYLYQLLLAGEVLLLGYSEAWLDLVICPRDNLVTREPRAPFHLEMFMRQASSLPISGWSRTEEGTIIALYQKTKPIHFHTHNHERPRQAPQEPTRRTSADYPAQRVGTGDT